MGGVRSATGWFTQGWLRQIVGADQRLRLMGCKPVGLGNRIQAGDLMKAISVKQPWATLIAHGFKDIENRTWMTRQRGTVLIHASKGMTLNEWDHAMEFAAPMLRAAMELDPTLEAKMDALLGFKEQQRGGIVGVVDIVDSVRSSPSPWYMGEVGFVLANARPLPFTPYKGALGFFEVPDAIVKSIDSAL